MTPYKLSENVIIDLDHLADAVWLEATADRRWLRVSLTTGTYHEIIGDNAERLWQYLLDRTPEAVEASVLVCLARAYETLVKGMETSFNDPSRVTIRAADLERVKTLLDEMRADLEQRSK